MNSSVVGLIASPTVNNLDPVGAAVRFEYVTLGRWRAWLASYFSRRYASSGRSIATSLIDDLNPVRILLKFQRLSFGRRFASASLGFRMPEIPDGFLVASIWVTNPVEVALKLLHRRLG